jgi:DNA-directed RNA polymerase specialized sigma24 family protein
MYWSLAWKAAYAVLFDRTLSDDATQETMLRVLRTLDTFDETRPFAPRISRIAVSQALDQLRRDRRLVPVSEAPGQLAMRTLAGKPLAFATVSETGRARLFTARQECFPD